MKIALLLFTLVQFAQASPVVYIAEHSINTYVRQKQTNGTIKTIMHGTTVKVDGWVTSVEEYPSDSPVKVEKEYSASSPYGSLFSADLMQVTQWTTVGPVTFSYPNPNLPTLEYGYRQFRIGVSSTHQGTEIRWTSYSGSLMVDNRGDPDTAYDLEWFFRSESGTLIKLRSAVPAGERKVYHPDLKDVDGAGIGDTVFTLDSVTPWPRITIPTGGH
jgi:hypothetical protein